VPEQSTPITFLVILPSNLGDVIMATPVLEGLKRKHKTAHVVFFAEEGFEAGVVFNPFCDRVVRFPRKKIRELLCDTAWRAGRERIGALAREIADERFDVIINLSQPDYTSFLVSLFGAKNVVGRQYLREGNHCVNDTWSQYLYAIPFSRQCNNLHATDVYRRIAGVKSHDGGYTMVVSGEEMTWARRFLESRGIASGEKLAIFQPGAAFLYKCWPPEHFVELGRLLIADGWRICVTGAPAEKHIAGAIASLIGPHAVCAAEETTFRQSAALTSLAVACVTGDTALMHASAALKVPTYALFGSTNPVETGPFGQGHFVFSGMCPQMPCFKTQCDTLECMKSILPRDVYTCIKSGDSPASCTCNVYKTSCRPNSDYSLVACKENNHRYFREGDACLVRSIFADRWNCLPGARADFAAAVAEAGAWLETVSDMCNALIRFESSHDRKFIRKFEELKQSLSRFNGLGAFCSAVLNIRLNSVPVLSPVQAIRQSIDVCWQTHKLVGNAIA
jgi:ADP-heptose:LPS heptosyltransferase